MDNLIETTAKKLGSPVDLRVIKEEFEKDPKAAGDSHIIETLFSMTDFIKFKELMVAYQTQKIDVHNPSLPISNTSELGTQKVV
mmetsp:Transcript_42886/g.36051  ORF Transcript_42886/g.36051 Transcript_42886/m.36051 type:complete len:84 (+) Transcript_42886:159-410(+)